MLPALSIPALVNPAYPILPLTFPLHLQSNGTRDIISPWGLFNNTFAITISLPLPFPFPFPILSRLPFPLPICCSFPFLGLFLTALLFLPTLTVVIDIAITRTAPSTARCSGIVAVLSILILVDYLIPLQSSNGQELSCLVRPAALRLNPCPEVIPTVPGETLAGVNNISQDGWLRIGGIDLIPEGMGVGPPPIVHLVAGFVKYLPHL